MRPVLKIALATAAYGALHSALASRAAKQLASRLLGERTQRAFYRPFFIVQAVITTGALVLYIRRQHSATLYHVSGPLAWLLRVGQGAALLHAYAAAREVGLGRITGLESVSRWVQGQSVPRAPVAQGPEMDSRRGTLTTGGPFRWSRHPLNLSPVPVFWLTPRMTLGRLAFNLVGTVYLVLGSVHEESRLRSAYGARYRDYQHSGIPFFLPRVGARLGPGEEQHA